MTAARDQREKEAVPGRGEENGLGPRQALFRVTHCKKDKASPSQGHEKNFLLRTGFEPVTYGCLLCFQLQSTALPTELSKAAMIRSLKNMPL